MTICKRCVVSGIVQGVYFRAATQRQARSLGVSGWVRNLPDGRVETLVCGDIAAVDEMIRWLWIGPTQARVSHVRVKGADLEDHDDFDVV